MARLPDGTVVPHFVGLSTGAGVAHTTMAGEARLRKGQITKRYSPKNKLNRNKASYEYDVTVIRAGLDDPKSVVLYPRCLAAEWFGHGPLRVGTDVLVLCLHGRTDAGLIVGLWPAKHDGEGDYRTFQFNDVRLDILDDSSITLSTPKGKFSLDAEGNFLVEGNQIVFQDGAGQTIAFDPTTGMINVQAQVGVNIQAGVNVGITAPTINLNGGVVLGGPITAGPGVPPPPEGMVPTGAMGPPTFLPGMGVMPPSGSSGTSNSSVAELIGAATEEALERHEENKANPHNVTAEQVGAATEEMLAIAAAALSKTLQDHVASSDPHPNAEGADPNIRILSCEETLEVGDLVAVDRNQGDHVIKADPRDEDRMPAIGIVAAKPFPEQAVVRVSGIFDGATGIVPGRIHWVSRNGRATSILPTPVPGEEGIFQQEIGVGVTTTGISISPNFLLFFDRG